MGTGSPLGGLEGSGTREKWWLHNTVNVLNAPELYVLNGALHVMWFTAVKKNTWF